jgi:hypothetical protein
MVYSIFAYAGIFDRLLVSWFDIQVYPHQKCEKNDNVGL